MFFPVNSSRFCGPAIDVGQNEPAIGHRPAVETPEETAARNRVFDRQQVSKSVAAPVDPLVEELQAIIAFCNRGKTPAQPKQVEQTVVAKTVTLSVKIDDSDPNSCFDQILFGGGRLRGVDC